MKLIKTLILLLVIGAAGAAAFVYFGVFNAAADVPHWPIVYRLMEVTRQRSIAVRAKDIQVPPLDDPKMIADGAEHYSEMCTGCHLAPGKTDSEIRPGLYPQPPNLSQRLNADPAEMFWAIKHGIKMSAMPAWGATRDDQAIWGMVAFLQKLPDMTPQQDQALTHSSTARYYQRRGLVTKPASPATRTYAVDRPARSRPKICAFSFDPQSCVVIRWHMIATTMLA